MYRALIIDDETGARNALKGLLKMYCPQINQMVEVNTGQKAIETARQERFDIAFVDIQLKKMNGIELAKELVKYCSNFIFVTAHDQYAIDAFRTKAVHYLLKPVDPQDLKEAVKRVTQSIQPSTSKNRLLLPTKQGVTVLYHEEIIHVQGDGNYCTFHCKDDKKYHVSKNLSFYEDLLNSDRFFRIHQSHLVNLKFVRKISTFHGIFIVLKNNEELPVSRRRKDEFLRVLGY